MSILIIEHSKLTGPDRLGQRLQRDGRKHHVVRIYLGEELPPDLDEIDGIIACGGPQAPDCTEPWVKQELNLLREADAKQLPILGICFGSQLLAIALGGEVARLDQPEIGWHDVTLTPAGRDEVLFAGQPWCGPQLHWHQWYVSTLPENAIVLATSEKCNVQAWRLGVFTYAIQFHPECSRETITNWIADDAERLKEIGVTSASLESETNIQFEDYERLSDRFFDAISHLLLPMHTRLARQRH